MLHQACCVATIFGLTLIPATRSSAASLTVSPILVEVSAAASTAAVTLRNREARPVNAQVRVFRWTQRDGEDHLAPTEDVVASPPIVTVQAGEDYTVRLLRITASPPQGESAYRIVVDELPDPQPAAQRHRRGRAALPHPGVLPVGRRESAPARLVDEKRRRPDLAFCQERWRQADPALRPRLALPLAHRVGGPRPGRLCARSFATRVAPERPGFENGRRSGRRHK